MQSVFFWGVLISICSYSFWRRPNYFSSSLTVTVFDPGEINIFSIYSFFRCAEDMGGVKVFLEGSEWHGRKICRLGQTTHSTKKCSVNARILVTYSATFSASKFDSRKP